MYSVHLGLTKIMQSGSPTIPIVDGEIKYKLNSTGKWSLTVLPSNPYYENISLGTEIVDVRWNGDVIWRGAITAVERGFQNEKKLSLENEMSFLRDTIMKPFVFSGTAEALLQKVVEEHNGNAIPSRGFAAGNVSIPGTYKVDYDKFQTSWDVLTDALKVLGGYIRPRRIGDTTFLDWGYSFGQHNEKIEFGKNLLDLEDVVDISDMINRLYPMGKKNLTISDGNNGVPYIENTALVERYGVKSGTKRFSDIETIPELIAAAKKHLSGVAVAERSIELTAIGLRKLGLDPQFFEYGYEVQVISNPHELNTTMLITEQTRPLVDVKKSKIVLGSSVSRFTSAANKSVSDIKRQANGNGTNPNESLTSVEAGEWTPTCPAFSAPSAAHGYYTKIGDMVTVSWFISGTSDSAATDSYSLAIYGLPYQPDTNVRWFGGGGNIANAETQGNHAFCGYVIDHMSENGSCIVPRTTAVTTSRASRGTLYAMNSNGKTIIMAGSLMYKIQN